MTGSLAKALGATLSDRDRDKVTAQVSRYLLKPTTSTRGVDRIHPSSLASEHWCPRSAYYGMSGETVGPSERSMVMEVVFETGHQAHNKWQTWLWEMGLLKGVWGCLSCLHEWEAQSPRVCPKCSATRRLLEYREVPAESEQYLIKGRSDGDVDGFGLIEIKTIGVGTIRWDAPHLLERHSYRHIDEAGAVHTGIDMDSLWQNIRVPFPAHIRQGMLYCFCTGKKQITFIYEPKFITAAPKEFTVQFRQDMVDGMLEECLVVKRALEKGRPPKRPMWAETKHRTCAQCAFKGVCWNGRAERDSGPDGALGGAEPGSKAGPPPGEPAPPQKAKVRFAPTPYGVDSPRR